MAATATKTNGKNGKNGKGKATIAPMEISATLTAKESAACSKVVIALLSGAPARLDSPMDSDLLLGFIEYVAVWFKSEGPTNNGKETGYSHGIVQPIEFSADAASVGLTVYDAKDKEGTGNHQNDLDRVLDAMAEVGLIQTRGWYGGLGWNALRPVRKAGSIRMQGKLAGFLAGAKAKTGTIAAPGQATVAEPEAETALDDESIAALVAVNVETQSPKAKAIARAKARAKQAEAVASEDHCGACNEHYDDCLCDNPE